MTMHYLDTTRWMLNRISKGLPTTSHAYKKFKDTEVLDECKHIPATKKFDKRAKILSLLKTLNDDLLLSQDLLDNLKDYGYINLYSDLEEYLLTPKKHVKLGVISELESYGYVIGIDYTLGVLSIKIRNFSLNIKGIAKCQL